MSRKVNLNRPYYLMGAKKTAKRKVPAENSADDDAASTTTTTAPADSRVRFSVPTPNSLHQLAVDGRKQNEIKSWLSDLFDYDGFFEALADGGQTAPRIALFKGPAGCGKTTAIRLIAKSLDIDVCEYVFEDSSAHILHSDDDDKENGVKQYPSSHTAKFELFLKDSGRYATSQQVKRLLLVEDLPNVFLMRPNDFHSLLRRFVIMYPNHAPIVFTWTTCCNTTDVFRVFTSAMVTELNFKVIVFNPASRTMIKKSLSFLPEVSLIPDDELETMIASCAGDLRVLFNDMEIRFKHTTEPSSPKSPVQKKRSKCDTQQKLLSQRQLFGSIFHFVGKIIYPKRYVPAAHLIDELDEVGKRQLSLVTCPSIISSDLPCSSTTLIMNLHQSVTKRLHRIEEAARCYDLLSLSEVISRADYMDSKSFFQSYAADISIYGLMNAISPTLVDGDLKNLQKSRGDGLVLQRKPIIYSMNRFCSNMKINARTLPLHQSEGNCSWHYPADLFKDILPILSQSSHMGAAGSSLITAMMSEISAMVETFSAGRSADDDVEAEDEQTSHSLESNYVTRKLSEVSIEDGIRGSATHQNELRIKGLGDDEDPDDYQIIDD